MATQRERQEEGEGIITNDWCALAEGNEERQEVPRVEAPSPWRWRHITRGACLNNKSAWQRDRKTVSGMEEEQLLLLRLLQFYRFSFTWFIFNGFSRNVFGFGLLLVIMPAKCRQWHRNAAFRVVCLEDPAPSSSLPSSFSSCNWMDKVLCLSLSQQFRHYLQLDLLHLYCNIYFVVLHKFPTNPLWRHQRQRQSGSQAVWLHSVGH